MLQTMSRSNYVRQLVSEIYAGGTANRVVLTTDGVTMTLGQIVEAQVTAGTITNTSINSSAAIAVSKLANGTKGYGLFANTTGALYDPISRRNRIDNGSMRISQRGTLDTVLSAVDNTYQGPDRWRTLTATTAGSEPYVYPSSTAPSTGASKRAFGMQSRGGTGKFGIFQVIESINMWDLRGQTVSLQAKLTAPASIGDVRIGILYNTGTADPAYTTDPITTWGSSGAGITTFNGWTLANTPANLNVTSSYATYKIENISINSSATNIAIIIWNDDTTTTNNDVLLVTDVQLEIGTICTSFWDIPIEWDEVQCLRYYEQLGNGVTNENFGAGLHITTNESIVSVPFKVRKRATPTVTISANGDFFVYAGPTPTTCNGMTTQAVSIDFWGGRPAVAGTPLTVGQATCLAGGNANARIYVGNGSEL